jgi:hypothetical protein
MISIVCLEIAVVVVVVDDDDDDDDDKSIFNMG